MSKSGKMASANKNKNNPDHRPLYVSPRVMRLDEVYKGLGRCDSPGSGNISGPCGGPGSNAAGNCASFGSGAAGTCANPGASVR